MALPTTTNDVTTRRLGTAFSSLWTKIKSTFQTVANKTTSWSGTPSDTKYPSEKLVKDALDGKVPGTTVSVSVPASATRYVKMSVTYDFHHYLVFFNASMGDLHAEWLFRTYGSGGNSRTKVSYIGAPVTERKWYVAGADGLDFYIEFVNGSTGAQILSFKVCALDISTLPTLSVVDTLPSGYSAMTISGTVAEKLRVARNLAVDLSNTTTNTSFNGTANVTNIKTTGVLGVANGGTGNSSVDTEPTENSTKMVTSGGIKTALDGKEDTSNKVTAWGSTPLDTKYPSEKLVKTALDSKAPNAPTEVTIANGDKIVITDASDNNKTKRASVAFDGITVNKMLTQKGTFETVKEGNLEWGGRIWTGSYGPLDAALIDVLGANRFAFGNGDGVTVEYTRDGGTTWTDYGLTKEQRSAIFILGQRVGIGKNDSNNKATADANWSNYKARITMQTGTFGVYTNLQKLAVYCATNGSQGTRVVITARTRTNEQSDGAWTSIATASLGGWSGWNIIPVSFTTWGNAGSQYSQIRFLFEATQASAESQKQYNGFNVSKIFGYGGAGWTVPSTMAASGHMYTYDIDKNVAFPARLTATSFNGKFTTARKLAVSLSNTSTDTSFDGSADVTNIKTTGTLGVGNGGTGKTSVTSNSFLVGNGSSAMVEKTPAQVLSLIGAQAAMTEMTTQEVTDFINDLGDL